MKIHRRLEDSSGVGLAALVGDESDRHGLEDIVVVPVDIDLANAQVLQLAKNVWKPVVGRRASGVLLVQSRDERTAIAGMTDVIARLGGDSLPLGGREPRVYLDATQNLATGLAPIVALAALRNDPRFESTPAELTAIIPPLPEDASAGHRTTEAAYAGGLATFAIMQRVTGLGPSAADLYQLDPVAFQAELIGSGDFDVRVAPGKIVDNRLADRDALADFLTRLIDARKAGNDYNAPSYRENAMGPGQFAQAELGAFMKGASSAMSLYYGTATNYPRRGGLGPS